VNGDSIIAVYIRIVVSIFEWCEFILGSIIVLIKTDWIQIEHDRKQWEER